MQYNVQTCGWNHYKDNNRKSLIGENHKQAVFFANFQTAGHSGFANDTEIRFIDKMDSPDTNRREHVWIDTFKTGYLQGFNNIDHTISYFFVFHKLPLHLRKMFIFVFFRIVLFFERKFLI